MIRRLKHFAPVAFAGISFVASAPALADDVKLPPTMAVTAYDTGTAGFNIAVGVGKMMKDKYGTDVRVLPAGNDVARLAPLRAKRALMSAMGSGTYFAQEGVFEFGAKEWGPQALQVLLSSVDCNAGALGVAADAGVKEIKDLKGKRVGFVVGSPALNQNTLAYLAFADLKQSDVKIVEFASYGAMWKGLINNDTDAAFGTTITGSRQGSRDVAARPGLAAAARQGQGRLGAGEEGRLVLLPAACDLRRRHLRRRSRSSSATTPTRSSSPMPRSRPTRSTPITKAMITGYDAYKDSAPGAGGLAADRQTKNWVVPVHPGAVKALKEAGQWTAEQEAHNNGLLKRQEVLAAAWADYGKSNPPSDDKAFLEGWMKARAAALAKANMPNGFDQ